MPGAVLAGHTWRSLPTMALDGLPGWLPPWCLEHLGAAAVAGLSRVRRVSTVFGVRLADGTEAVVKARPDDGRAGPCATAQARLAEHGFPCPRPLTPVVRVGALAVHAEEHRPGGDMLYGDSPEVAALYAEVFARIVTLLDGAALQPPLPNPRWVRWDHLTPRRRFRFW